MATRTTGTLIYQATHGHKGKVVVDGVTSMEQLKAIRDKIDEYVDATCTSVSFCETEGNSSDSLAEGNTDRKAVLKFRDNNTVRTRSISIPGFKSGTEDSVLEKEGERVVHTVVTGIIETIAGAVGGDFTALSGDVIQGH